MVEFTFTVPSGFDYTIEGDEGDEEGALKAVQAMFKENKANYARVAQGMDPRTKSVARSKNDEFGWFLREQAKKPRPGESQRDRAIRLGGQIKGEAPGYIEGTARAGLEGLTLGYGGELTAGIGAMMGPDSYKNLHAREQSKLEQFRVTDPWTAYPAEIAGAIPTAMLPMLNAARGGWVGQAVQKFLPKLSPATANIAGQAIKTGAGQGAIYGSGSGNTLKERLQGATIGGTVGGAVGGLTVPVTALARKLFDAARTSTAARAVADVDAPTYTMLNDAMTADGAMSGQGAARIAGAGPEAMLADSGVGAQQVLDAATQGSGKAANIAGQNLADRVTVVSRKLLDTLDDMLGVTQGYRKIGKAIAQRTSGSRSEAYEAAYSRPIDYASEAGREIKDVLARTPDDIMSKAVKYANETMKINRAQNEQIIINIADDGAITLTEMPNVIQLDYLKRALQAIGREVDNIGRPTPDALNYKKLGGELRGALGRAVDDYDKAVKLGGDKIAEDNALRMGYKMLRSGTTREDVAEVIGEGLSEDAKAAMLRGLRSYIDDTMANVKRTMTDPNVDAREISKIIKEMSSHANREKTAMVLGDDVGRLFSELDETATAFNLRASQIQNSKTHVRKVIDDKVTDLVEGGVKGALRKGDAINFVKRIWSKLAGGTPEATQLRKDEIYARLAEVLTGPQGSQAQAMLSRLREVPLEKAWRTDDANRLMALIMGRNAPVTAPAVRSLRDNLKEEY